MIGGGAGGGSGAGMGLSTGGGADCASGGGAISTPASNTPQTRVMCRLLPCPEMDTISTQTKGCLQRRQPQLSLFQRFKTHVQISHRLSREIIGSLQLASTDSISFFRCFDNRIVACRVEAKQIPR